MVFVELCRSCPVCGVNLYDVGPAPLQESALIGTECKEAVTPVSHHRRTDFARSGVICLEEFVKGKRDGPGDVRVS